jgi:membrane protease YdiL (CAAX protease family)
VWRWGLLRLRSGSIVVPSFCHALWNASAYTFFGTGEKQGQLGIADPSVWDPERGYAGLVLAVLVAALMWWWVRPQDARRTAPRLRERIGLWTRGFKRHIA